MRDVSRSMVCIGGLAVMVTAYGCRTPADGSAPAQTRVDGRAARTSSARPVKRRMSKDPIRRVVCLYDQKPWLNLDTAGDPDPEGIRFRVFLIPESRDKGVHRDGTLRVQMYRVDHTPAGTTERALISDWAQPTDGIQRVKSKWLGMGYHLRLRWARKDTAGSEVQIITHYEDPYGNVIRSGTKRLRVPKYSS